MSYKEFINLLKNSYISSYIFKDGLFTIIFGLDFDTFNNQEKKNYINWIRLIANDFWFGVSNNKDSNGILASKIMDLRFNEFKIVSINITDDFISFIFENDVILTINNLSNWTMDNIISGDFQSETEYLLSCENKKFSFIEKELSLNDRIKKLKDVGAPNNVLSYHLEKISELLRFRNEM